MRFAFNRTDATGTWLSFRSVPLVMVGHPRRYVVLWFTHSLLLGLWLRANGDGSRSVSVFCGPLQLELCWGGE